MAKDHIKEALADVVPLAGSQDEWSRALGRATYEVMWSVAPHFEDLVLDRGRLVLDKLLQLGVAHDLRVVLQGL